MRTGKCIHPAIGHAAIEGEQKLGSSPKGLISDMTGDSEPDWMTDVDVPGAYGASLTRRLDTLLFPTHFGPSPDEHPLSLSEYGRRGIRDSVWGDRPRCHCIPNGKANPGHYPNRRSLSLTTSKAHCTHPSRVPVGEGGEAGDRQPASRKPGRNGSPRRIIQRTQGTS